MAELSWEDKQTVKRTTEECAEWTAAERAQVIKIHQEGIAYAEARLQTLRHQVEAQERVIALRTACLGIVIDVERQRG